MFEEKSHQEGIYQQPQRQYFPLELTAYQYICFEQVDRIHERNIHVK